MRWLFALIVVAMASIVVSAASAQVTGGGGNVRSVQYGAFCREGGDSPYGMATPGGSASPSPYPTFNGNLQTYLYGTDASGNSIDSANPLDPQKLKDLTDLGVQWCRQTDAPIILDQTHVTSGYNWGPTDAILGELKLLNIVPAIGTEIGPVEYNDCASVSGWCPAQHYRYDKPSDFASFCGTLATHVSTVFGDHLFSIIGNEINSEVGATDGNAIFNGSPPPPALVLTSGGSLATSTAVNYEVTAIVNGVETMPSAPYYSNITPTSGNQTIVMTWGPSAAETGGYKVYRLTSGVYKLLGTTAHGVTTYTDNGTGSVSGTTPPSSSLAQVGAFEADYAAYMIPCYQAIKTADPAAIVYGFELNMVTGLTPTPATFVSDEVALGCGPGTCYDGISLHLYPPYPMSGLTTPCLSDDFDGGSAYSLACLQDIETAAGANIPLMIGEYAVTVPGVVSSEATASLAIADAIGKFATYPYVQYISYSNVDECALYPSGFFYGGCLVGEPSGGTVKALRWQAAHTIYSTKTGAVGRGSNQ